MRNSTETDWKTERLKNRIMMGSGGIILAAVFVASILSLVIVSEDPETGQMVDGWGRPLVAAPLVMRLLFTDRLWAGWSWFFVDGVTGFFSLLIGFFLFWVGWRSGV